jgi:enterochelin esterase-like enzyme
MQILNTKFIITHLCLIFLLSGCQSPDDSFTALLYRLGDMPEAKREGELQSWLNKRTTKPVVESGKVYFIYQNKKDIPVYLTGDMNHWAQNESQMLRIIGTSYYYLEQSFPLDARLEYKFIVDKKYISDPFNEKTSRGGFGENSLLLMPDYKFPVEVLARRFQNYTPLDTLTFESRSMKDQRMVILFKHPLTSPSSPLLVFNDGSDYLSFAQANIILDNLIEEKKIPPCYALFIKPVNRMKEYWLSDLYLEIVFKEIVPFAKEQFKIIDENKIFFGGVSLGGLSAFYALKDYGNQLDGVFGQSPSFWVDSLRITNELNRVDLSEKKLFFDYGLFEKNSFDSSLINYFRDKAPILKIEKYNEGHAWGNWKAHLDNALVFLLNPIDLSAPSVEMKIKKDVGFINEKGE